MSLLPHVEAELTASELCANLRIIAADAPSLSPADRGVLTTAAAEIELAYRQILADHAIISEQIATQTALRERINALTPKAAWSMGATVPARVS